MAHKTLTISEEAYNALKKLKREGESFSETILRMTRGSSLLDFIKSSEFDEELTGRIEEVYRGRSVVKDRKVNFDGVS